MSKVSKKTVFAGVAGTIGVVASTQIPGVQAAVEKLTEGQVKTPTEKATTTASHDFSRVSDQGTSSSVRTSSQVANSQAQKTAQKSSSSSVIVQKNQADNAVVTVNSAADSNDTAASSTSAVADVPNTPAETAAVASTAPQSKPANTTQVTIQDGDTLSAIAAQYGVTVDAILDANQTDLSLLQIGTIIYVPEAGTTATSDVTNDNNSLTDTEQNDVVSLAQTMANEQVTGISAATFVSQVFGQAGITLPASTIALEGNCTISTGMSNIQPGELLFWGTQGASYNVAISLGGNLYVGVSLETGQVQLASFDATNGPSFIGSVNA
ncbi:putative cell wall-associated hydrolase [Weissella oryzae SG25]|uniref:Putative cell wall-associated hydrolase n=1 Tax=Weissella oryzae (strain DSM 25784 / JCM 18191 / LMG 30913 / SG25) TaxID=1329250 RepID=A0A069CS87_WEIOS|nr:LysM peptidoglycan-binding domain-containing protein [Weissella oryzae]GAK30685.1 putative cell wall-associated hydrolase [Weissella oryzae SG25]